MKKIIDKLQKQRILDKDEFIYILQNRNSEIDNYIFEKAKYESNRFFGKDIYIRGLIEFTNYCKNNCYYCGIRCQNSNVERYRLSKYDILECCKIGYEIGFRTFVFQGGEDYFFDDDKICQIVYSIKNKYPDCAVTLSIGERSYNSYLNFFKAGADRYLLRHETANNNHYSMLHPKSMSLENRKECLFNLKQIGFQVGCGFMVGSPFQTLDNISEDLLFMKKLNPHMVGIGPFIPHKDTKFKNFNSGSVEMTLFLLSIIRIMFPKVLLPSTTALSTIDSNGREKGILAGANVIMPNLSPVSVRKKYSLYNNKICMGDEAAEYIINLKKRIEDIGYKIVISKGDYNDKIL